MYKLITLFFCVAVLSNACKKNNEQMTAKNYESKLKEASQKAHSLMRQKGSKSGKIGNAMSAEQSGSVMTEAEATQIIQPLLSPSTDFLRFNYDINISDYFPPGSPKIVQIGALAMRLNQLEMQGKSIDTSAFENWYIPGELVVSQANGEILSYAQPSVVDCALDALGIPAALIVGSAKNLTRVALIKAAKKLLARTIGYIGAAIAVYDFGDCMGWW